MYKLNGHTLEKGVWFLPESQALTLTERSSTSTITLGPDAPAIGFNDWLYDEDSPGGPYVWRVKSITEQNSTNTISIELEHPINLLEDQQVFGEVTTEDISGSDTCYASEAVAYLLDGNHDWVLGAFEVDNECPYEFETLSVMDAIKSVTDTLEGVYWDYDLSVHPFVLNIRALDMNPGCEMREGRNLSSLRRSVSRSGMYTRIYPIGENDLQLPNQYISRNEEIYGRIDKVVTDSTKTTLPMLGTWAEGLLMHNSDPDVSITISGLDLSESTGEPLDRLRLHRFCRCPLPEYGTTIIEKITKLQWRDRIKEPDVVTVTLANNADDLSEVIKSESKAASGGGGAAGQAKQNYIFEANGEHLYYDVHNESGYLHGQLEMTAESLRIGFENEINSTRSELIMTSESLRIHFENEISSTRSEMEMTSESLRIQFENEIASARSEIQITAESLRISFESDISSTRSEIQVTAQSIRASVSGVADADGNVTAASITLAINNTSGQSEAHIDASHIWIGNEKATTVIAGKLNASDVTAEYLAAKIANIPTLQGIAARFSGNVSTTSGVIAYQVYADGNNISNPVMETRVSAPVNNVYTLQHKTADGTWHDAGTFSRATSLSGSWSGNKFTVTASPQGNTASDTIAMLTQGNGSTSFSVSACHTSGVAANVVATQNIYLTEDVSAKKVYARAGSSSGTAYGGISTQATYDAGSTAGYNSAKMSGSWNGATYNITKNTTGSVSLSVTLGASISYDSTTHKYTANANAGGSSRASATSGTEAYSAGKTAGLHEYYDSDYWSHSGGSVYVPNRNNTGSELWFEYDTYSLAARAVWGRYYDGSWHYYNGGNPISLYYAT